MAPFESDRQSPRSVDKQYLYAQFPYRQLRRWFKKLRYALLWVSPGGRSFEYQTDCLFLSLDRARLPSIGKLLNALDLEEGPASLPLAKGCGFLSHPDGAQTYRLRDAPETDPVLLARQKEHVLILMDNWVIRRNIDDGAVSTMALVEERLTPLTDAIDSDTPLYLDVDYMISPTQWPNLFPKWRREAVARCRKDTMKHPFRNPDSKNLFVDIPFLAEDEQLLSYIENGSIRIERIVSNGQGSPRDFWYDQETAEWVVVLRGRGAVRFEDGRVEELGPGDWLYIPPHAKHRVDFTDPAEPTLWLAVHWKA